MLEYIGDIFHHFVDPKKRVFIGYIVLSVAIAFFWLVFFRKKGLRSAFFKVFDKKILLSGSAISDYKMFLINRVLMLVLSPYLLTQLAVATFFYYTLLSLPVSSFLSSLNGVPTVIVATLFTVVFFTFDDFTKYWVHRWMHKWPILWALHKVHHSAETLNPITVYRTHPLEGILFSLRGAFSQGIVISMFFFIFGDKVDLVTILGVNFLVFSFHVAGSNLRHSHIDIKYWSWLEKILISPAQHQLHHSLDERHYDKNFGAALAIWDWIFGSLHHSEDIDDLVLGVEDDNFNPRSIKELYLKPLKEILNIFSESISSFKSLNKIFKL
jgi:sterol desaturase/sphingolipid hydroxylase (fatty acid hydroxylase superfamily)